MTFAEEITELIRCKHEGAYWDFKQQWYDEEHRYCMLHDIICMANNLAWRDAYIIIGVNEEANYSIHDITADPNRRNTQMMVTFLRDKPFAGGIRPEVEVKSIEMESNIVIDVLLIRKSKNTPYYLSDRFHKVEPHRIYSRIQDTNTPIDKSADPDIVEKLWANRFGLNATALERAQLYLQKPEDWVEEDNDDCRCYHSVFPEYKISHYSEPERTGYEYYLFSQVDSNPHWWRIELTYHQTVLYSQMGIALDGGRVFIPCPDKEFIDLHVPNSLMICCYVKESMKYDLFMFFLRTQNTDEAKMAIRKFVDCIIFFQSESEKQGFLIYARSRIHTINLDDKLLHFKPDLECYQKDYEIALKAKLLLKEYRQLMQKYESVKTRHEDESGAALPESRSNCTDIKGNLCAGDQPNVGDIHEPARC